jgi:hypothetical protein
MLRTPIIYFVFALTGLTFGNAQATVRVEPMHLKGADARPLEDQTASSAIRDYLEAWQSLRTALEQNRADLLDRDFVGTAKDKLTATIRAQVAAGIHSSYQDRVHDLQILFYSPEGLSIELADRIDYDVQILDHDKAETTQHLHARYVVVMTPAEVRWRVRVFQAASE